MKMNSIYIGFNKKNRFQNPSKQHGHMWSCKYNGLPKAPNSIFADKIIHEIALMIGVFAKQYFCIDTASINCVCSPQSKILSGQNQFNCCSLFHFVI